MAGSLGRNYGKKMWKKRNSITLAFSSAVEKSDSRESVPKTTSDPSPREEEEESSEEGQESNENEQTELTEQSESESEGSGFTSKSGPTVLRRLSRSSTESPRKFSLKGSKTRRRVTSGSSDGAAIAESIEALATGRPSKPARSTSKLFSKPRMALKKQRSFSDLHKQALSHDHKHNSASSDLEAVDVKKNPKWSNILSSEVMRRNRSKSAIEPTNPMVTRQSIGELTEETLSESNHEFNLDSDSTDPPVPLHPDDLLLLEVQRLWKKNKQFGFVCDDQIGQNYLHVAAYKDNIALVEFILEKSSKKFGPSSILRSVDKNQWTPLHCAASKGNIEICEILLLAGASPNALTDSNTTALDYIVRLPFSGSVESVLNMLYLQGADLDLQNVWGDTSLITATDRGGFETIQFLVKHGANVNVVNNFGESALIRACRSGNLEIVKYLAENGADLFVSGYAGSALMVAQDCKFDEIAAYLREKMFQKNSKQNGNNSSGAKLTRSNGCLHFDKQMTEMKSEKEQEREEYENGRYKVYVSSISSYGPSLDNISVKSLLSIQRTETNSRSICTNNPTDKDIVVNNEDFYFELGKSALIKGTKNTFAAMDLRIDEAPAAYVTSVNSEFTMAGKVETNYSKDEPIIISILLSPLVNKFIGVIRTKTGYHKFWIPEIWIRENYLTRNADKKNKKKAPVKSQNIEKELLALVTTELVGASLWISTNPKFHEELLKLDNMKINETKVNKIGILYAKEGQVTEEEIFGNYEGSEAFEEFLLSIGEKVRLKGFTGYKGDLDVKTDTNGEYSIYSSFEGFEIMFHVSTYLPFDKLDPQQIPRKKYIGNDLVSIVFLEGGTFKPPCVSGDFLQVFIVVQPTSLPDGSVGYKVGVCCRNDVPHFGPPLPSPAIFRSDSYFKDFLLTKILNAESAALRSPYIMSKVRRTQQMQLNYLIDTYPNDKDQKK
eukprot:CAMPEP_0174254650 /NCGR_PEP_ID=MMETSP0439-20130205/3967_1 /TAXON_ID=0 /ORGANISM="Stereomyxa ramosa, Strain Chinc5" /LENGTH=949 /DNA_ID=CAMNT_0015336365 /DNA_START=523 /DNA_END=3372 /DNA_ORIENTATION=+